ncbi:MAG: PAS domain-containing protein [Gluconacetobacter diazotrophicus]|nr:PAS domain-containing protein [Gluconacetobacter diazotrophicus]
MSTGTNAPDRPLLLLVDDEPEILVALEDLLDAEFRVLTTTRPADGLAILREHPEVSVIVSDQRMPGMQGDRFLAEARGICRAQAILLTGYADLSAVVAAVNDGGISGYAHKPWEPTALLAMVRAAARRAELAEALLFERSLLDGLMGSTDDGMSFKDRDGRLLRLNRAAAAGLGHADVERCIGAKATELLGDRAEADQVERGDRLAMGGDGRNTAVIDVVRRNGSQRWMQRLRGPLRDAGGRVTGLVTLERDITAEKLAEDRGRQADRMQALGTMAGGVAHDFNNLLTAILGSLEIAQRHSNGNERLLRLLGTAVAAAERGATLTRRLLTFSRRRDAASERLDVNEAIRGMVDLLVRSVDRATVVLRLELAAELPPVTVDPAQFELALMNLCVNARDAIDDDGVIAVRTRLLRPEDGTDGDGTEGAGHRLLFGTPAPGGMVVVEVEDRGTGMTEEVAARMFEPFFTTKEIGRGTGLGLPMVYGFVLQSSGAMRLRTAPGEGTSFEVCLPVAVA